MQLDGATFRQLQDALLSAFPSRSALEQMVRFQLDKNLAVIASGGNLATTVFELIQAAEAGGWLADLVHGAGAANPGNPSLRAFIEAKAPARPAPAASAHPARAQGAPGARRTTLLPDETIRALHAAAIRGGLVNARGTLFGGISPGFMNSLPMQSTLSSQLLSDLHELNRVEKLLDGTVPLAVWLSNAITLLDIHPDSLVFQDASQLIAKQKS
ncbi:MAG: effector-associated domain EAD1-containing protein [Byssovorax sp.]